jgi:arylsulfatase A-like enzyme
MLLVWSFTALFTMGGCGWFGAPSVEEPVAEPAKPGRKGTEQARKQVPPAEGPNVLIIVWDTVRADRLSAYGYGLQTTPRLEAFAKEAVLFERAMSPAMWTLPSHASMFTGLPPRAHGAVPNHKWLDDEFTTMSEWYGDHGYATYLFSANPYLDDQCNLSQGFDKVEFPWDPRWKKKAEAATMDKVVERDASNTLGPAWKETVYSGGRGKDRVKDAGVVTSEALLTWVKERPSQDRPFLAVLNYMEAHVPRIPSMESRKALFDDATIEAQLALDQEFSLLIAHTVELHEFSPAEIELISSTYDAALRDLDAVTGVLFDQLQAAGLLDDTVVILTADHGEHLGEHHRLDHKFSVYNPLVHVPLLIRYPKRMAPARVDQVVSTLEIWGTIAELTGVPMPEGTMSRSLLHLDQLAPEAYSELIAPTPQAFVRMRKVHKDFDSTPWEYTYGAVTTTDAKCIERNDGHRELYAQPGDSLETNNLYGQDPEADAAVCDRIAAWRSTFKAYTPSKGARPGRKGGKQSDEERARLEALGYLQEDEEGD